MMDRSSAAHALTLLSRLALRQAEGGEDRLARWLAGREEQHAELAIEVAVETGGPVGRVLAQALAGRPKLDPELIYRLGRQFGRPIVRDAEPLRELSVFVLRQILALRSASWKSPTERQRISLAVTRQELSQVLLVMGRREEARAAALQAIRDLREADRSGSYPLAILAASRHTCRGAGQLR